MKYISILLFCFSFQAYSGLCDKEKREYLDAKKEVRKVAKLRTKEQKKALKLLKTKPSLFKGLFKNI